MGKLSRHSALPLLLFPFLLSIAALAFASVSSTRGRRLELPFGPIKSLSSPDGSHLLYGAAVAASPGRSAELWLKEVKTGRPQKILDVTRTLSAGWSPDGSFFFVQNNLGSNVTEAYLFETATLKCIDIGERISASDLKAKQLAAGHAYFNVMSWLDGRHLLIDLNGHTDVPPVECFDLRYQLGSDGTVVKLSERIAAIDDPACK